MIPPEPVHFWVSEAKQNGKSSKDASTRVAPGMTVTYNITFTPEERKRYACDLMIETERERFCVPIVAQGFKSCVHHKTIIIYNTRFL